jgi:hypothetical protein
VTAHKHLKQLIRARMEKTGERYATARRHIIGDFSQAHPDPAARWHLPGSVPATTALRILLTHAGVRAPHTGQPFSEAMLFGLAGGVGVGVFSFYYEQEDAATFYVAGRHQWHDDVAYLGDALGRFGLEPVVQETGGAKAAEQQLRDALGRNGPCIAWVDAAGLPHRAMPSMWSGGGYHVVEVYNIGDQDSTALIGDLADDPISIPLADLAQARARIKKFKHRLMAVAAAPVSIDLGALVRAGLERCHAGLLHPSLPGAQNNARLDALRVWARRMHGSNDKERWERVYRPGGNLWRGLCSIYDFVEHYGTGGGLCRPLFADFLAEAGEALGDQRLGALAERYAELGRGWSELAEAALPDDVPELREAKQLYVRKAELVNAGGSVEEIRAAWARLAELEGQAREQFPLTDRESSELRARLQARIMALYEGEVAAHAAIPGAIA